MTPPIPPGPLRVEQALRFLPPLESLAPLRSLLLAMSESESHGPWRRMGGRGSATIGKRAVTADALRPEVGSRLAAVQKHLADQYESYVVALECQEQDDTPGAVQALRVAGRREEDLGRLSQARAWYEVAGRLAAELRDRRPEIETLTRLGTVSAILGRYADGARHFQRALVLAEAEFDQAGAIAACEGLGRIATGRGEWTGALAWFTRTLRLAEAGADQSVVARQYHRLAILALRRGELAAVLEPLQRAQDAFEHLGLGVDIAWTLRTRGLLEVRLGRTANAQAAYREALAWLAQPPGDQSLELSIRLDVAELHMATARFLEAEEDLRRVEQTALQQGLVRWVVQAYGLMGRLRGLQRDQDGFVFFEEAMQLCHGLEISPAVEGRLLHEYGDFCLALDMRDEARAYLERARELFEAIGRVPDRDAVRAELRVITA